MPTVRTDKQLAQRQLVTTSVNAIYTVPNQSTKAGIAIIAITNTTGASATYSLWINQGGTATGDGFALVKARTITANATDQFIYPGAAALILNGDYLHSSASIMVQPSTANALTVHLHGYEVVQT